MWIKRRGGEGRERQTGRALLRRIARVRFQAFTLFFETTPVSRSDMTSIRTANTIK